MIGTLGVLCCIEICMLLTCGSRKLIHKFTSEKILKITKIVIIKAVGIARMKNF
jgi:hypothetical protein